MPGATDATDVAKFSCSPGQVIAGRYRVSAALGGGGMGEVYAVEHLTVGRQFALKLLRPELAERASMAKRFEQEARAASVLHSIHIVPIIDRGETEDGVPFFVMELLHGEDLGRWRRRALPSPALAAEIVRQAAAGAGAAHRHGIVHRDVKPANIFITAGVDGTPLVKLLDFGVAKVDASLASSGSSTKTGAVLGTAAYMSPEQARGQAVDARSDVYSLGVVLYELLTGRRPFDGDSYNAIIYRVLTQEVKPITELRRDVSSELQAVVLRAMARELDHRYQTAADLAAALAPFGDRLGSKAVFSAGDDFKFPGGTTGTVAIQQTPSIMVPPAAARGPARTVVGLAVIIVAALATLKRMNTGADARSPPAQEAPRANRSSAAAAPPAPGASAGNVVPVQPGNAGTVQRDISTGPAAPARPRAAARARAARAPDRSVETDPRLRTTPPGIPNESSIDEFVRRNPYAR